MKQCNCDFFVKYLIQNENKRQSIFFTITVMLCSLDMFKFFSQSDKQHSKYPLHYF